MEAQEGTKTRVLHDQHLANIYIFQMTNLQGSGLPIVISQALYAIVGAVALQKGGDAANTVARERILEQLGLN